MTRNTRRIWDRLLELLIAVKLGQQLGTDSDLAQTVAHGLDFVIQAAAKILG